MKNRRFVFVALAAACGLAAYGVYASRSNAPVAPGAVVAQDEAQGEAAAQETPAAIVAVDPAVGLSTLQPRQYAGRIVSIEEVDVVPRVTGWIKSINFEEGDFVKEGDLLFELEDTTYQAAYKTAQANLDQAQAVLKNAEITYNRTKGLLERNAGSQADFDNADQGLAVAKASVAMCEAALTDATNTLSYTKITAPISGRIGKVTVTRGNLVTPQTGKIVDIRQFAPIHIRFAIGESVFNGTFGGEKKIRDLAQVKVCPVGSSRTDSKAIETYPEAKIDLIDNHVDSSTNTLVIWAVLPNEDNRFFPGSYATVMLSRKLEKPVPAVLQSAIQTAPEGNFVWVVKDGKAAKQFVTLGPISHNYYVIDSGVEIGDKIVVEGMNKLTEGAPIQEVPYASWETTNANGAPAQTDADSADAAPSKNAQ